MSDTFLILISFSVWSWIFRCLQWYHQGCVGLASDDPRIEGTFVCPPCEHPGSWWVSLSRVSTYLYLLYLFFVIWLGCRTIRNSAGAFILVLMQRVVLQLTIDPVKDTTTCGRPDCEDAAPDEFFVKRLIGRKTVHGKRGGYSWLVEWDGYVRFAPKFKKKTPCVGLSACLPNFFFRR